MPATEYMHTSHEGAAPELSEFAMFCLHHGKEALEMHENMRNVYSHYENPAVCTPFRAATYCLTSLQGAINLVRGSCRSAFFLLTTKA